MSALTDKQRDDLRELVTIYEGKLVETEVEILERKAAYGKAVATGHSVVAMIHSNMLITLQQLVAEYQRNIDRWTARLREDAQS